MRKKILLVSRHAPYGTQIAREAIDATLAVAVYDQDLSLLFMDDGVFQLLSSQNGNTIAQKNIVATLGALPLYDVEKIYVHRESLHQRGLAIADLAIENLILLDDANTTQLFSEQAHILSF